MAGGSRRLRSFQRVVCFCTHIRGRSFVGARTGERDKFMTAFVDHKTAHCRERDEREIKKKKDIYVKISNEMTKMHFTKTATRISALSCLLLGGRPRLYLAPTLHFRCFYLLRPHGGASHHHINHLHIKGRCRKLPTETAPHGSGPWTPRQSPA